MGRGRWDKGRRWDLIAMLPGMVGNVEKWRLGAQFGVHTWRRAWMFVSGDNGISTRGLETYTKDAYVYQPGFLKRSETFSQVSEYSLTEP